MKTVFLAMLLLFVGLPAERALRIAHVAHAAPSALPPTTDLCQDGDIECFCRAHPTAAECGDEPNGEQLQEQAAYDNANGIGDVGAPRICDPTGRGGCLVYSQRKVTYNHPGTTISITCTYSYTTTVSNGTTHTTLTDVTCHAT